MHKCKICSTEFETLDKLRRHNSRVHKISSQETYNEFILNGIIPTCKCGCGEITNFTTFTHGYKDYKRGHVARIKNNWGHNQTAIDKSSQTRREQYNSGNRKIWNIGLTKETDERVAKYGNGVSNAFTDDRKKEYSVRMTKNRLSGIVPTRYGKDSANWKGGTSPINSLVRREKRLYTEWIYPILKKDNFTCQTCGNTKNLEVHHNNEQMSEIIKKFINPEIDYTFDFKLGIVEEVIDYHIDNKISGKTLCKKCHKKLHPSYNT